MTPFNAWELIKIKFPDVKETEAAIRLNNAQVEFCEETECLRGLSNYLALSGISSYTITNAVDGFSNFSKVKALKTYTSDYRPIPSKLSFELVGNVITFPAAVEDPITYYMKVKYIKLPTILYTIVGNTFTWATGGFDIPEHLHMGLVIKVQSQLWTRSQVDPYNPWLNEYKEYVKKGRAYANKQNDTSDKPIVVYEF